MRVLAVRNVAFEHVGLIAPALRRAGIHYDDPDPDEDVTGRISAGAYAGLIVMGGPMSANNDSAPVLRALRLIEEALSREAPILGVCLGAQLIAKALGARIYRNAAKEIGWAPVYWTEEAAADRLFDGLTEPETVFHWHGEMFDLPRGATRLAWSDACGRQAFRAGDNIYGLQFHLEVTPEMITDWLAQEANQADVRELTAPIDPRAHAERLTELAGLVFGRWCDLVKQASRR